MISPDGGPNRQAQANRPKSRLRHRRGHTVLELMLYVLIVTVLGLAVLRSVKIPVAAKNSNVEVLLGGLDNLMVAHQLTKPVCTGLVNDSSMNTPELKSAAQWCWLFPSDYNPVTRYSSYPSRKLSDFWGSANGRDTGDGKYVTQSGIPIRVFYNVFNFSGGSLPVVLFIIDLSIDQIKTMGYDQCYSLVKGLYDRLVPPGFGMQVTTGKDGAVYMGSHPVGFNQKSSSYDPKYLNNYCAYPYSGSTSINIYLSPLDTPQ